MKLKIDSEKANLKITTDTDLDFNQLVMAYSLVTGKKYDEDKLAKVKQPVMVKNNMPDDGPVDNPETVERLKNSLKEHWPLNHVDVPERGNFVTATVQCPKCGYSGLKQVKYGYSYWRCPECGTKLFMAWSTGIRGEADRDGCYYILNQEYKPRREDDEAYSSADDGPAKPNAYSTLTEIKEYLDSKGVNYSQARLKNDFVRLLEEN
ncbi:hypothetical protein [Lactiplantibacillus paraxiangfangensis]|uniref:hypothetical protein n=1 Tax=Lactiplantibacillus paraxiangfangensis TaxID=3076224 RepID=UPI0030C72484